MRNIHEFQLPTNNFARIVNNESNFFYVATPEEIINIVQIGDLLKIHNNGSWVIGTVDAIRLQYGTVKIVNIEVTLV
jgi:exosome complex RNA-binding protein Csl4